MQLTLRRSLFAISTAVLMLAAVACGTDSTATPLPTATQGSAATATVDPTATPTTAQSTPTATQPEPTATTAPATGAMVAIAEHDTLGQVLADEEGKILYLFTRDEVGKSNCTGDCLTNWPPLMTEGMPQAGEGVAADRLGAIDVAGGGQQATYNGWPLYYFANDAAPGDANGQDRGDVWYVVSPFGGPIFTAAPVELSSEGAHGPHLVDNSGRVQYLFANDNPGVSNCEGNCALNWPPLLTVDDPVAGEGLAADRLGTLTRTDGSKQVTYNGWPLYYFAQDIKPGDTVGQDRGGVWYLVGAEGGAIQTAATVKLSADDAFGDILTDVNGRVLYLFTNDEPGVSNCEGNCALNWPPLLTVDDPVAAEGADAELLDVISRGDGINQVTYNGWPLYYYAEDTQAGDKVGQARGDVWWVVNAEGEAVMEEAAPPVASNIVDSALEDLTVSVGQAVRWTNQDSVPHTATSSAGSPATFDSGNLSQGGSYSFTFADAGAYPYFCEIHPDMTATVTVNP